MTILYYDCRNVFRNKCQYYGDIVRFLARATEVTYISGDGEEVDIEVLVGRYRPRAVILGFSITDTGERAPNLRVGRLTVPVYVLLNKEYAGLTNKLNWIKALSPTKVFTVHHHYRQFEAICGVPFVRTMWSADEAIFRTYDNEYKQDLFFSGVMRTEQSGNIRQKIYDKISLLDNYTILCRVCTFNNGKLVGTHYPFDNNEYAQQLNWSKIALTTTGPADLVGTRYFEIMATNKAMILCNRMPEEVYEGILVDKVNCVMFDDEADFVRKFKHYIDDEEGRMAITRRAYSEFRQKHMWEHKITHLLNHIN